ncbi:hypothetical protein L596_015190 [Steinernema carpocapsae]|uniref:Zinc transporter ZIP14 n=2 Tax=Steinernema carpocapsae TaxID=34508 RepID=A0A4U5NE83_STECR|nr:hypothetical protein L596_015190 [Steinernema carpocapsae]
MARLEPAKPRKFLVFAHPPSLLAVILWAGRSDNGWDTLLRYFGERLLHRTAGPQLMSTIHEHSYGPGHHHGPSPGAVLCSTLLANSSCNMSEYCIDLFDRNSTSNLLLAHALEASPPLWQVWGIGLFMVTVISGSAACGIAIIPFLSDQLYNKVLTFFVALGVGTLSGSAVFHLIPEAFDLEHVPGYMYKSWMIICGIYLFFIVDKLINLIMDFRKHAITLSTKGASVSPSPPEAPANLASAPANREASKHSHSHDHSGNNIASVAWLVIFSDGLHNFIDGLSIGVAFKQNLLSGISISVAVLCEELPHELGDCAILISSGMSYKQALFYNLLSASTCYIGFILGVLIGELDHSYSTYIFALAGGMFLYISLCSMLSEMNKKSEEAMRRNVWEGFATICLQFTGLFSGIMLMYIFGEYGHEFLF